MTNTDLPTFPNTPRARTALRDLLELADAYDKAAFLPGRATENLIDAVRVIRESIEVAAAPLQPGPTMGREVRERAALTQTWEIDSALADMTDGSFEVVAYEVFDHPGAVLNVSEATAKRHGVDPGSELGVWFLGPRVPVEAYVMGNFSRFHEVYCYGYEGE